MPEVALTQVPSGTYDLLFQVFLAAIPVVVIFYFSSDNYRIRPKPHYSSSLGPFHTAHFFY